MSFSRLTFLSSLLLAMLLFGCASAPQKPQGLALGDYSYAREYLGWLIRKEMRSEDVTGLSIAVVDDQRLVWAEGFGYADLEQKIPATPETIYQLGSISKLFTATAVMQLAEQGRLGIDQPLQDHLRGFSIKSRFENSPPITIRNLLTHHAGLPANMLKGMSVREPESFSRVVEQLRDEYVAYPPNKLFDYSNVGYTLLGATVEQVSGEPYAGYMERHLLQPMGMEHSFFAQRSDAKSYNNNREIPVIPLRDTPSAGLNSNVLDISRFMRMVLADGESVGGRIVKRETLAEMLRPQNSTIPLDLDFDMGLGWMLNGIDVKSGGRVVNHGGTTLNFQTLLLLLPEQKLGVVVLSNTASSHMMVNRVATATMQTFLEAKTGIRQPPKQKIEYESVPLSPALIQAYSGYYDTMAGLAKVKGSGGSLEVEALGKGFVLQQRKDGRFSLKYNLFGLFPIYLDGLSDIALYLTEVDGHQVLVGDVNGQAIMFGEKLPPPAPLPQELLDYAGAYEFVDDLAGTMPARITVMYEEGRLIGEFVLAEMPGFIFRVAFQPVSSDEMVVAGLGGGKGETLRLLKVGGERRIRYSGIDVRRIDGGDVAVKDASYTLSDKM